MPTSFLLHLYIYTLLQNLLDQLTRQCWKLRRRNLPFSRPLHEDMASKKRSFLRKRLANNMNGTGREEWLEQKLNTIQKSTVNLQSTVKFLEMFKNSCYMCGQSTEVKPVMEMYYTSHHKESNAFFFFQDSGRCYRILKKFQFEHGHEFVPQL